MSMTAIIICAVVALLWTLWGEIRKRSSWRFESCCTKWPLSVIAEMQEYPDVFMVCEEEKLEEAKQIAKEDKQWEGPHKLETQFGRVYYFEKSDKAVECERAIADKIYSRGR